jgi:hypothetical protein
MTDHELGAALVSATETTNRARDTWHASAGRSDRAEGEAALLVVRHATALQRSLEQWMTARALRALEQTHVTG